MQVISNLDIFSGEWEDGEDDEDEDDEELTLSNGKNAKPANGKGKPAKEETSGTQ